VIPALYQMGLPERAVRRAWQALRRGGWSAGQLVANWEATVLGASHWQVRYHGGYCAVAVDITGFWRPRLKNCPTKHYHHQAGKALPAIVLGIIGRVGQIGQQRLLLPLGLLRTDLAQPEEEGLIVSLITQFKELMQPKDVLVSDGEFPLETVLTHEIPRFVAKQAKNFTARRGYPPEYAGQGRPPELGEIVRPLPRTFKGRQIAATPPDRVEEWQEDGVTVRAEIWDNLVLRRTKAEEMATALRFSVVVIHDPRFANPLVLATSLTMVACDILHLYLDRWAVEQLPLVTKQMIGAARAFVFAPEVCQRLPELALLAGAILSYAAAILPAIPTGFWDRTPQPTPGRLRRFLGRVGFPINYLLPPEIRQKASFTDHLPKGSSLFRRVKGSAAAV
jgi:hypothetical protein